MKAVDTVEPASDCGSPAPDTIRVSFLPPKIAVPAKRDRRPTHSKETNQKLSSRSNTALLTKGIMRKAQV